MSPILPTEADAAAHSQYRHISRSDLLRMCVSTQLVGYTVDMKQCPLIVVQTKPYFEYAYAVGTRGYIGVTARIFAEANHGDL